jgi:hypothetical protein
MKNAKKITESLGLQRFVAICGLVFVVPFGHSFAQNIPAGPNAATKDRPLLPTVPGNAQMPGNSGDGATPVAAAKLAGVPTSFVCSAQNEQISDLNKLVKL